MNHWHGIGFFILLISIAVFHRFDGTMETVMNLYFSGVCTGTALCSFVMSFYEQARRNDA